ncbi:MAG TPA: fasciclin domain-containing protein [Bacteroidia bacterium]|nr:fasciclin domain-containing protein [Bacteroidia bacterium]HOZ89708.1 fasciclin domain-containing protein [Bacteroidia bacterium]HQW18546.1 fasciclin domain-containing protein [Bacteroidia bacterium]HQW49930.1 fasciclin domain-containing protein [Bacteroidia bacterium]HQX69282.1 fasciclin domain-containing protein [Bacteroidia bacterium]
MNTKLLMGVMFAASVAFSCNPPAAENQQSTTTTEETQAGGQEAVIDDDSQKDIVKIAVGSADHSTLVAALKQADYVTSLSNAGPFTVFAPTNEAFNKLPAGTVDDLMKPENKAKLQDILEYHVSLGVFKPEMLTDGQTINQANLKNITISNKDNKIMINNQANIIATIPAANGVIHVIDAVLLPPDK